MSGAARIPEIATQPGQPLLEQGDRVLAAFGVAVDGTLGIVQQVHQRRSQLFRTAATLLMLERMPLTIPQLQALMQGDGQLQGIRRPGGAIAACGRPWGARLAVIVGCR